MSRKSLRSLVILAPLALALAPAGCDKDARGEPKAGPRAAAPGAEKAPALHRSNPATSHRAPRAEPRRAGDPEIEETEHSSLKVWNVTVPVAADATASIEIRPKGTWKMNTDFPVRLELEGSSAAEPHHAAISHSDPTSKELIRVTSGGARIDVPFRGKAPGADVVSAHLRYGVCSLESCWLEKVRVSWRVEVGPARP